MQQAEEDLGEGDTRTAGEQQQEALDDLEQAEREVAEERREAEERLAQELYEKVADQIQGMIARQQNVLEETQRLEEGRKARGNWTRPQLKTLVDLAENQRALQTETESLAEQLSVVEVFALALKGAARSMEAAAELLKQRDAGEVTQRAEQAALKRFVDLVEALKPDEDKPDDQQQQQEEEGGGGGGSQSAPPQDGVPNIAQLKMLKLLQQDLIERTANLAKIRRDRGKLTEAEQRELQQLAQEQLNLADLVRNLTKLATPDEPEEKPHEKPEE
jgi:hypothetical protein